MIFMIRSYKKTRHPATSTWLKAGLVDWKEETYRKLLFFLQILVGKWPCAHTSAHVSLEIVTSARDDRLPTNWQWLKKNQPSNFQTIGQTSYSKNPKMPKENSGSATSSMRKNPPKIGFPDPTAWAMTAVPSPCSATLPSMLLRLRHRLPPARNGLKTLRSLGSP